MIILNPLFFNASNPPSTCATFLKPKKQTQPPNVKNKKTAKYRNEALTYAKNQTKWSAAREYCEDRQMNFLILTEDHLGV